MRMSGITRRDRVRNVRVRKKQGCRDIKEDTRKKTEVVWTMDM